MKITRVEAIHLRLPDVNERCDGSQETLVVKVHTDEGIVGVGEVDSSSLVAKAIIEAPAVAQDLPRPGRVRRRPGPVRDRPAHPPHVRGDRSSSAGRGPPSRR